MDSVLQHGLLHTIINFLDKMRRGISLGTEGPSAFEELCFVVLKVLKIRDSLKCIHWKNVVLFETFQLQKLVALKNGSSIL
jgi:hypothetical protein